jgi:hypothetical protein
MMDMECVEVEDVVSAGSRLCRKMDEVRPPMFLAQI